MYSIQPIFAQWIQKTHFLAPNLTAPNALASTSPSWGGDVVAVGGKVAMMLFHWAQLTSWFNPMGHVKFAICWTCHKY
jgi:hypothetical protein